MFKLIRRLFRWALYLFIVAVVLVVAAVLLLNTIVKQVVQSRLRSETGMDVKIGKMDIGLSTPTIAIEDFKVFYPPRRAARFWSARRRFTRITTGRRCARTNCT